MTSSSLSDNNVFNSNFEEDIYNKVNLLIRLPDREFGIVCSSNRYYNNLCNNSFYSERIFEERTRRLVDNDIIAFKESNMTWKDFYMRLFAFLPIQKQLIENNFEEDYTDAIFDKLILEDKLMEMKIIKTLYDKINRNDNNNNSSIFYKLYRSDNRIIRHLIIYAISNNRFTILKWLLQNNETPLDIKILYFSMTHNEMFKYLYDYFDQTTINNGLQTIFQTLIRDNNIELLNFIDSRSISQQIYENIMLADSIYLDSKLDTVKWLHSKGVPLTSQAMNKAIRKQDLPMIQWFYERGIRPTINAKNLYVDPEIHNWLTSRNLL